MRGDPVNPGQGRFITEADHRGRLPVLLLSGFLGSGKTTLLNRLLRDARLANTAVAVNEFGEVGLDQHLIEHGADRTVVMANGCLCCNLAGDLEDAVMRVFSRRGTGELPRFDRLIIEPSGLADPAPIAQAVLRNPVMSRVLRLDGIVCAVDAVFGEAQLARHAETRKQAGLADALVLTKTDLVDAAAAARVRAAVRRYNPAAPIHGGAVDAGVLLPPSFLGGEAGVRRPGFVAEAAEPVHTGTVTSVSLLAERPLDWARFDAWLRGVRIGHGEALLRVKAMLNVAGAAGPVVVQGVHHVVHAPVQMAAWPDGDRRSRLVLILDGVDAAPIRAGWDGMKE